MQFPFTLWTDEEFYNSKLRTQLFYGALFGLILVMIFYNCFLFFATRDTGFLIYCLYMLGAFLFLGTLTGYTFQFLFASHPLWFNVSVPVFMAFWGIGALLFTRSFLQSRKKIPRLDIALKILLGGFTLVFFTGPFVDIQAATRMSTLLCILSSFSFIFSGFMVQRTGYLPARYFTTAWIFFSIGVTLYALKSLGVLPTNTITHYGLDIGTAVQTVLISMALGDRINVLKLEKEQAQEKALEVQQRATEMLEEEVNRKTQDLQNRTLELEEAYARLAEHERLKSQFFANVSHEIRTPLTLIITPLERILTEASLSVNPDIAQRLRSMKGNAQRLLRLVNQLLDFSRIESGATTLVYELRNIHDLVSSVVEGFLPFARSKDLTLTIDTAEEPPLVYVDSGHLEKVLCNLVSNACKFTPSGGSITVKLSHDASSFFLIIEDTGIGIAENHLNKIFERFHQVDGTASRRFEGTGIGLALSKELIELMGGSLSVRSNHGIGSAFTVTLPLGQEHIKDASLIRTNPDEDRAFNRSNAAAEALASEVGVNKFTKDHLSPTAAAPPTQDLQSSVSTLQSSHEEDPNKPTVLIVEDNSDIRSLIVDICKSEFSILEASNGEKALELVQAHHPSLVISDIMMPIIDGNLLIKLIRDNPQTSTIPVILLTAKTGFENKIFGLESGADDYIYKPFESRELLARARNMVRLQQQERALRELNSKLKQEVLNQASTIERTRRLHRFLPPEMVRKVIDEGQQIQVEQQRANITVFVIKLSGFDEITGSIDPEDMAAILNNYLSSAVEIAFYHGATVDRFFQDTVLGFCGAPNSKGPENDALQCAQMVLDLWQKTLTLCEGLKELLPFAPPIPTVALASGYATVGTFGSSNRLEFTAVGGPVDEVLALINEAEPGEIICTHKTMKTIKGPFQGKEIRVLKMKKRPGDIKVYQIGGFDEAQRQAFLIRHTSGFFPPVEDSKESKVKETSDKVSPQFPKLQSALVLCHRYKIIRRLGQGGMGAVYLAKDIKMDVNVALKIAPRGATYHELKRLYREARLARLISHSNIARIFDLGEWDNYEFITMEYIEGEPLDEHLLHQGSLPFNRGIEVLKQICSGLSVAHLAGIVHRDLKPANIMVEASGRIVILDFGTAYWTSALLGQEDTKKTLGTPNYMAPEQFLNQAIDQRTDIYALGLVAYEMFTGHSPYNADSVDLLAFKHTYEPPPSPTEFCPHLPPSLEAMIMRCLAKSPSDRFQSIDEIISYLISFNLDLGQQPETSKGQHTIVKAETNSSKRREPDRGL